MLVISIQDLRQDPQDTSAFYLENIYQLLARSNISSTSFLSAIAKPPSFSPPRYACHLGELPLNSLWFLGLVISLTSALLASLLQRWARRYVEVTQPQYSPHKRARVRASSAHGLERMLPNGCWHVCVVRKLTPSYFVHHSTASKSNCAETVQTVCAINAYGGKVKWA